MVTSVNILVVTLSYTFARCYYGGTWVKGMWVSLFHFLQQYVTYNDLCTHLPEPTVHTRPVVPPRGHHECRMPPTHFQRHLWAQPPASRPHGGSGEAPALGMLLRWLNIQEFSRCVL